MRVSAKAPLSPFAATAKADQLQKAVTWVGVSVLGVHRHRGRGREVVRNAQWQAHRVVLQLFVELTLARLQRGLHCSVEEGVGHGQSRGNELEL